MTSWKDVIKKPNRYLLLTLVDVKSDTPTPALSVLRSSRMSTAKKLSPATQPLDQREVLLNWAKHW